MITLPPPNHTPPPSQLKSNPSPIEKWSPHPGYYSLEKHVVVFIKYFEENQLYEIKRNI